jgi:hypothetical protein
MTRFGSSNAVKWCVHNSHEDTAQLAPAARIAFIANTISKRSASTKATFQIISMQGHHFGVLPHIGLVIGGCVFFESCSFRWQIK